MDIEALKVAAVDQAGDGIIVIDREGVIRVWNRHAETLFGWTAAQAIGQDVKLIIPERLRSAHDRGFFRAIATGRLSSDGKARHTKGLHSSGESVYVTMTFALILDPEGRALGSVAVAREWNRAEDSTGRSRASAPAAVSGPAGPSVGDEGRSIVPAVRGEAGPRIEDGGRSVAPAVVRGLNGASAGEEGRPVEPVAARGRAPSPSDPQAV